MIQGINAIQGQFLSNLNNIQQRLQTTEDQISSGIRVAQPSDDPADVGDILQLEYSINSSNQVTSNLNAVQGSVNTADSALESANDLIQSLQSIAAQGASSTSTAAQNTVLSQQVGQILSQLVGISQTTYEGQYVFSGDLTNQPLYQVDPSSPTGVDRLAVSSSTQVIQDSTGLQYGVALSANQIFDNRNPDDSIASNNVFAAVSGLQTALANNDQTAITNSITSLSTASNYLNGEVSFYGGVQNRITSSLDIAEKFQTIMSTSLQSEQDTDIAAATTNLAQENLNQQAAVEAEASIPQTSLFDYLNK
jgi:flagellar hook-associated protein 3 FlgL